jgi:hypothetical protein
MPFLANAGKAWADNLRSASVSPMKSKMKTSRCCSRVDSVRRTPMFKTTTVLSPEDKTYSYSRVYTKILTKKRKLANKVKIVEDSIKSQIVSSMRTRRGRNEG